MRKVGWGDYLKRERIPNLAVAATVLCTALRAAAEPRPARIFRVPAIGSLAIGQVEPWWSACDSSISGELNEISKVHTWRRREAFCIIKLKYTRGFITHYSKGVPKGRQ